MARLNALLIALALACAIGVIAAQHQARKLFIELEREQDRMRELEVEWGQLQLEAEHLGRPCPGREDRPRQAGYGAAAGGSHDGDRSAAGTLR